MTYKNILQIDDDYDDCEFFEQALKAVSDAHYTAVTNPLDALRLLINKEIMPDLIFLDVNMPLMSGPELLTEIKKRDMIKNIPVIILSTAPLISKNNEKVLGAKDFLVKPNTFSELKNMIRNTLI